MLTGLADAHVKSGIVDGVRRQGMDIVTAQGLGLSRAEDEDLLVTATQANRLMLTNDADFLRLHAQWMQSGRHHSGIVYWRRTWALAWRFGESCNTSCQRHRRKLRTGSTFSDTDRCHA